MFCAFLGCAAGERGGSVPSCTSVVGTASPPSSRRPPQYVPTGTQEHAIVARAGTPQSTMMANAGRPPAPRNSRPSTASRAPRLRASAALPLAPTPTLAPAAARPSSGPRSGLRRPAPDAPGHAPCLKPHRSATPPDSTGAQATPLTPPTPSEPTAPATRADTLCPARRHFFFLREHVWISGMRDTFRTEAYPLSRCRPKP